MSEDGGPRRTSGINASKASQSGNNNNKTNTPGCEGAVVCQSFCLPQTHGGSCCLGAHLSQNVREACIVAKTNQHPVSKTERAPRKGN